MSFVSHVLDGGSGVGGTDDVWMAGGSVAFAGVVWPVCGILLASPSCEGS